MRILSIIISAYLLTLSFLPCGDERDCDHSFDAVQEFSAEHTEESHLPENCTPICVCNCCGSSVTSAQFVSQANGEVPSGELKFSIFDVSFAYNNIHSIWRPPKVS
ncbi:MAG: DUF6660 family protein [Ignavibacteria bacterium]|nr:hypothetical protein [Ignavibacteria bacterium]